MYVSCHARLFLYIGFTPIAGVFAIDRCFTFGGADARLTAAFPLCLCDLSPLPNEVLCAGPDVSREYWPPIYIKYHNSFPLLYADRR